MDANQRLMPTSADRCRHGAPVRGEYLTTATCLSHNLRRHAWFIHAEIRNSKAWFADKQHFFIPT
jgi:hypothetical protein